MKKPLTFLVVLIFAMQLCGYYSFYFFRNIQLHLNPIERLQYSPAQRLVLARPVFEKALIEDDELRLGREMFDIVSVVCDRDSVTVLAFRDNDEEMLLGFLINIILPETGKAPTTTAVDDIFQLQFLKSFVRIDVNTPIETIDFFEHPLVRYKLISLLAPTPPPWTA